MNLDEQTSSNRPTLDSGTKAAMWVPGVLESSIATTPGTLSRWITPLEKSLVSKNCISLVAIRQATVSSELNRIAGLEDKVCLKFIKIFKNKKVQWPTKESKRYIKPISLVHNKLQTKKTKPINRHKYKTPLTMTLWSYSSEIESTQDHQCQPSREQHSFLEELKISEMSGDKSHKVTKQPQANWVLQKTWSLQNHGIHKCSKFQAS